MIIKDVTIKKEIDEKVNAYKKQLESKYMKLIINKRIDKIKRHNFVLISSCYHVLLSFYFLNHLLINN